MNAQAPAATAVTQLNDQDWNALVEATPSADIYFRPGYVRAYEAAGHGRPVALLISAGESRFLLPLLLRPLSELIFAQDSSGFDAISPYGYGGIFLLSSETAVNGETVRELFSALREWCHGAGVVSVMLRLHPLMDQQKWFEEKIDNVELRPYGPTIAYDLQQQWNPETGAMKDTNRGRRSALSYARRHLTVNWASTHPDGHSFIEIFRGIYDERMGEIGAADFYYFPPEYYASLVAGLGSDVDVVVVRRQGVPVGSTLVMAGREAAHAHLTGSNELGREYNASTLLMIECTKWARQRGCRWLLVGGGPNHLFNFKESFGGAQFPYSFVTFIADPSRYSELTAVRRASSELPEPRANFFPEYRA
jgi:hypothetical protein